MGGLEVKGLLDLGVGSDDEVNQRDKEEERTDEQI